MRLLVCKIFLFIYVLGFSQSKFNGKVIDALTKTPIAGVSIYNTNENKLFKSNQDGLFELDIKSNNTEVLFYLEGYNLRSIFFSAAKNYEVIELSSKIESLDEVVVRANKKKVFQIERLKDFEETYVYAGKKNEVIFLSSNTWDVSGGGNYGYQAIWVNRNRNVFDYLDYKPKNQINSLKGLLDIIK